MNYVIRDGKRQWASMAGWQPSGHRFIATEHDAAALSKALGPDWRVRRRENPDPLQLGVDVLLLGGLIIGGMWAYSTVKGIGGGAGTPNASGPTTTGPAASLPVIGNVGPGAPPANQLHHTTLYTTAFAGAPIVGGILSPVQFGILYDSQYNELLYSAGGTVENGRTLYDNQGHTYTYTGGDKLLNVGGGTVYVEGFVTS